VLQESGQLPAAIALYRTWIAHTPSPLAYAACFNLAVVLSTGRCRRRKHCCARHRAKPAFRRSAPESRHPAGTHRPPDEALAMWHSILSEVKPDIKQHHPASRP
jgi:hypothetical protein